MSIAIPQGMLEAALAAAHGEMSEAVPKAVEAALGWLADNPVVPTEEYCDAILKVSRVNLENHFWIEDVLVKWQQDMFKKPEPDDPLVTYIMRHFALVVSDKQALRRRAESAVEDFYRDFDHGHTGKIRPEQGAE